MTVTLVSLAVVPGLVAFVGPAPTSRTVLDLTELENAAQESSAAAATDGHGRDLAGSASHPEGG